jgi:hypothetical protein
MEAATGGAESVAYASERDLGRGDGDHGVYWRRRLTSHSTGPTSMEGLAVALNTMTVELLALLFFQIKDRRCLNPKAQVNLATSALSIFFLSCCVGIPKRVAVCVFE